MQVLNSERRAICKFTTRSFGPWSCDMVLGEEMACKDDLVGWGRHLVLMSIQGARGLLQRPISRMTIVCLLLLWSWCE